MIIDFKTFVAHWMRRPEDQWKALAVLYRIMLYNHTQINEEGLRK